MIDEKKQIDDKKQAFLNKIKAIKEQKFTDAEWEKINNVTQWYIPQSDKTYPKGFAFDRRVLPFLENGTKTAYFKFAELLYVVLKEREMKREGDPSPYEGFSIRINITDRGVKLFRASVINDIEGRVISLRKTPEEVPNIDNLYFKTKGVKDLLISNKINNGLILIAGETGNGKSYTCGALLQRRCENGSFVLTIEDPPELPLHGYHGKGYCFQTEVQQNGFADAIRNAMRSYPSTSGSILFVGEVRDRETAEELVKISANGHIVVATIHGSDCITALKRLVDLSANGGASKDVMSMLASSLRFVVHQKLDMLANRNIVINTQVLLSSGVQSRAGGRILANELDSLLDTIMYQENQLEKFGSAKLLDEAGF